MSRFHNAPTPLLAAMAVACIALCSCGGSTAGDGPAQVILDRQTLVQSMSAHIRYLASDDLEGRAPGSRGEELTLSYLSEQYANLGWRPGNPDGTYVQQVPLVGYTVTNQPAMHLDTAAGAMTLAYREDFMGWTLRQQPKVSLDDAELIFVGYGIVAPEYGWDDYKDVNVRDKIIVMLVGDPPLPDTTMFGGKAMTYYGRWTYKYEIAASKGAAGAIVIHNTFAAGYPWEVVANSWSGEQFDVRRGDGGGGRCALEAWINEGAAERLFASAGLGLDQLHKNALRPEFEPIPLGARGSVLLRMAHRDVRSYNVVAKLVGQDPELKDEYMVYTAHWDHLGIGNAVDGDSIYNGALDNATGCAATLELAREFALRHDKLKRSVLIINTTAEESGLLGSYYYAEHPFYPLEKTVALVNIDGLNVWGRTADMVIVGYGQSTLDDYLEKAINTQDRRLKPDAEPEKGYYYRSDHFPFAQKGVPALYADSGIDYRGKDRTWGLSVKREYTNARYHKPQDEFDPQWDLDGAAEDIEALFRVGLMLVTSDKHPEWSKKSEFRRVREDALRGSR